MLPVAARSATVRRLALRDNAAHGERVAVEELIDLADDLIGCVVRDDLLRTREELAPLDPPPCPVTLAWSERDRILPLDLNGARARTLVPGARWVVLPDVGHVPMLDDPQLVADTILTSVREAAGR
jgi:pimeloyl-ACP methyl ester carboxylesterase